MRPARSHPCELAFPIQRRLAAVIRMKAHAPTTPEDAVIKAFRRHGGSLVRTVGPHEFGLQAGVVRSHLFGRRPPSHAEHTQGVRRGRERATAWRTYFRLAVLEGAGSGDRRPVGSSARHLTFPLWTKRAIAVPWSAASAVRGRDGLTWRERMLTNVDYFTPRYRWEHTPTQVCQWYAERGFVDVKVTDEVRDGFGVVGTAPTA
jgi:hypothetical protein